MSPRFETATVHDLVSALRNQRAGQPPLDWTKLLDADDGSPVCVHGAHHGAGASTIAVALTDALCGRGVADVSLIDLADHEAYGASEAIEVQADLGLRGWTGGRRGGARIVRLGPPDHADDIDGNVVVDVCRHGRTFELNVVVCRGTVLSIRRAESILARAPDCVVAVVGASKWPAPVRTGLGPLLAVASSSGRVVFFPRERALEVNGLSAEPLPQSTLRAAGRLLDLLAEREDTDAEPDPNRDIS
jgi:hypothetical protein